MLRPLIPAFSLIAILVAQALAGSDPLDSYNVAWHNQSDNSGDSMPCVGGDIGLNVWVENNQLLFYMARAGCRDENGSLLKLGRTRVSITPSPFADDAEFQQVLNLRDGSIDITSSRPGINSTNIRIWVETHRPVVHAEVTTTEPSHVEAAYENWRTQRIELPNTAKNLHRGQCLIHFDNYPGEVFVEADTIRADPSYVRFWHHMDEKRNVFHRLVDAQSLTPIKHQLIDPCRNLIFGGQITGTSFTDKQSTRFTRHRTTTGEYALTPFQGWCYRSPSKAKQHRIDVVTHIAQTETIDTWHRELDTMVKASTIKDLTKARQNSLNWWNDYWSRSYIHINPDKGPDDAGWRLSRNYALFRYMLASGLNGREPIMFNGGVLTFDPTYADKKFNGPGYTPDHRQWGSALTAQNQRCIYWPMLKSGDSDLIIPGFDFYKNGLTNARERTRHYWDHDGCSFTEQTTIQWLPGLMVYGYAGDHLKGKTWRHRPVETEPGVEVNKAVNHLYEGQLEWAWMILEYHRYTGTDISPYMPFIEQSVIFYDEHYRMREKHRTGNELTANGKLHIHPSNTLEGHPNATNPTSVIAGLHQVLTRLAAITNNSEKQQRWQDMLATLPDMPTATAEGRTILRPTVEHESFSWHMPAMYPLFPYQMHPLGSAGQQLMRDTFLHGISSKARMDHRAWIQGVVHFAHLGMVPDAKELIIKKLDDGPYRFPAFWPPAIDHAPDHNWGGMAMIGLQDMLMQTADERILLLPAWPEDWEVEFKLHAPGKTVIEANVNHGKVKSLNVTPTCRSKDIVVWTEQQK